MDKALEVLQSMTLKQKIAQLQCALLLGTPAGPDDFPDGVGELALMPVPMPTEALTAAVSQTDKNVTASGKGIPPLMHVETLTGVSAPGATVFPTAIGLGATFDPETVGHVATVIHDEMQALGYTQALAPVLDVCRDPRWGRTGETYGEDPTLNAMIGTAYVKALQGEKGDKLCATGKHFLGYGMSAGGINMATCVIPPRELREVYAKPFQAAITEGGLLSVMNSYGTVDGEMIIGSKHILTDLLRKEMEFDGIVVSDYASIEHLVDHKLAPDIASAGLMALRAGLDVECPQPVGYQTDSLLNAVHEGRISEEEIDQAVLRVLRVKQELGLLGGHEKRASSEYGTEAAREISLEAARKSIVLLKNNGTLPLEKKPQRIAVIGPHADSVRLLFGCYTFAAGADMMIGGSLADQAGMESSVEDMAQALQARAEAARFPGSTVERDNPAAMAMVSASYPHTPTLVEALRDQAPMIEFDHVQGCDIAGNDRSGFEAALEAARQADVVLMTLGGKYGWGGSCTIGEGIDSDRIGLPGVQEELALAIAETGKPLVLIHMDARPFSSVPLDERAAAILECWFPGTSGGRSIAEVLFGEFSPAGRLSMTALRSTGQIPIYHSQYTGNSYFSKYTPTSSCRYVDSTPEPLYCFGHGLSYTRFEYRDIRVSAPEISSHGEVTISCHVKNVGERVGEEVVQLYVSDDLASMLRPFREFAGCARLNLRAGEEREIRFIVRADQFAFIGADDRWRVEAGHMTAWIGSSSENLPLQSGFTITDTAEIRPARRGFFARSEII